MQDDNNAPPNSISTNIDESDTISQIFDKILKRILLHLSKPSVVALINGLFSDNFPPDSEVSYNHTENVDGKLKRTVADIIITLRTKNRVRRFHMEGQINDDNTIVIRVFEYGFHDALRHQNTQGSKITLPFPAPVIIFLEHTESTPDKVILELDFGEYGKVDYPVPAIKFLNYSVEEICKKRMTILLPLYLLKLRREVENAKNRIHQREDTLRKCAKNLKMLIEQSLLPAIIENEKAGNITPGDAFELIRLLDRLYAYLYGGISEFKDEEVDSVFADVLELKYDVELAEEKARMKAEHEARLWARLWDEKRKTASKMKKYGDPVDKIADITGLSFEEIQNL